MSTEQPYDVSKVTSNSVNIPPFHTGEPHETATDPKWAEFNKRMAELRKRGGRQKRRARWWENPNTGGSNGGHR